MNEVTECLNIYKTTLWWLVNKDSTPINTFNTKQNKKIRYQNEVNLFISKIKFDLLIHQSCETSLLPNRLSKSVSK